ncbi:MAG: XRE family transcriptional regulator [Muribaculaceae bacterium]|nr:XRE family transcriptional regulator [Muribaculaceae bacterium]
MDNLEIIPPQPMATPVDRVRYLIRLLRKTQAQFGQLIGLDPSNLSRALSGGNPLRDTFLNRIVVNVGVSKEWLLHGTGVPFPKGVHAGEIPDTGMRVQPATPGRIGAPVYDIDVTAGCSELSRMFTDERIIGYLDMPGVSPDFPICRVSGDSMSPKISNGAYVSMRPLSDTSIIFWGQIYVVIMDDFRMVKYVRRHNDPSMVVLHSANPAYDDMEVPRDAIRKLYMVESIFNFEIVG